MNGYSEVISKVDEFIALTNFSHMEELLENLPKMEDWE